MKKFTLFIFLSLLLSAGIASAQVQVNSNVDCVYDNNANKYTCTLIGNFDLPGPDLSAVCPACAPCPACPDCPTCDACPECPTCPTCDDGTTTPPPTDELASISTNRISGIAPLAVFFDGANGARDVSTFQDIEYTWNFGDVNSGELNVAEGPLAAHIYSQPGTYRTMVSSDGKASGEVFITVSDPDAIFTGTNTMCASSTGNFDGCPTGAVTIVSSSFSDVMSTLGTGIRILFRRGDAFVASSQFSSNLPGPIMIGAFGAGSAPIIQSTHSDSVLVLSKNNPKINEWTISDLHFTNNDTGIGIKAGNTVKRLTVHNVVFEGFSTAVSLANSYTDYYGDPLHSEIAVSSCIVKPVNRGFYGLYIAANKLMVVGNDIQHVSSHILRIPLTSEVVISHNTLADPGDHNHLIKLHAEADRNGNVRTSYHVVINRNTLIGTINDWNVALGPQSARYDERVENGVVENNRFISGPTNAVQLLLWSKNILARNNRFDFDEYTEKTAITITQRGIEPPPVGNRVLGNICYSNNTEEPCIFDINQ